MRPGRTTAVTLFALVVVGWGLTYDLVRLGVALAAPLWLALFRAALGAVAVLAYLQVRPPDAHLTWTGRRDALLLGIPHTGLFFGLWFVAAGSIAPGVTSVLIYTFPLWVALLTVLLERTVPSAVLGAGLTVGFAGVVLVAQPWRTGAGALPLLPLLELLLAAFFRALGTVLIRHRFGNAELAEANGLQMAGGAGVLLLGVLLFEATSVPAYTPALLGIVLWIGLPGAAIAYGVWFYLMQETDAPRLAAFTFLVPVIALVASIVIFQETWTVEQIVGIGLILAAMGVVAKVRPARSTADPRESGVNGPTTPGSLP